MDSICSICGNRKGTSELPLAMSKDAELKTVLHLGWGDGFAIYTALKRTEYF